MFFPVILFFIFPFRLFLENVLLNEDGSNSCELNAKKKRKKKDYICGVEEQEKQVKSLELLPSWECFLVFSSELLEAL